MTASLRSICCAVFALLSIANASYADNWPGWRGPRGDGSSAETNLPTQWSASENIVWKVAIPGEGHACPVVWGDRIFIATAMAEERLRVLMCLDRKTGAALWQRTVVTSSPETKHQLNTYASSTPVTDGELVYATFFQSSDRTIVATNVSAPREVSVGKMIVAAYDFEGNQQWIAEPGEFISVHGYCSCPVLFENLLIVNGDHDGDSFLVALSKLTGKIEWKVPRVNKTRSYCTPIIREFAGRTQMIMSGNKSVTSYNPRTGELLWSMDGPTEQFVASMVDNGKYVFLTAGYPDKHILAIDPTGSGTIDESKIAWRSKRNCSYVPSPIVVGNYFLVTSDDGILSCYDSMSGERVWFVRLGSHYNGSPVSAGGLVYFTADNGITKVVRPGAEYELVSECKLDEECYASPAIAGGQIFIRTKNNLICIGK